MIGKAVEMLVTEIAGKAFKVMGLEGRTKLRQEDVMSVVQVQENLDFYVEAVQQDESNET